MSKRMVMIVVVILIILILGVVAFTKLNKASPVSEGASPATTTETSAPTPEAMSKGTFKDLMAAGKNQTCHINYPDQTGSGTVYITDGKMRADFNVSVGSKATSSHMLNDGTYVYVWTDGVAQGTKFKTDIAKNYSPAPNAQNQTADLNKEYDLKCTDGVAESSLLVVPTTVKFSDMTQMMSNIMNTSTKSGTPKIDKSVCDSIADATAKAACLKALGG